MQKDLNYYERQYGTTLSAIKDLIISNPKDYYELISAGVRIWKATGLPVHFIADKMDISDEDLQESVEMKINTWKAAGQVPKNDPLLNIFSRYFPELTPIKYTFKEISKMGIWNEPWDKDYFLFAGITMPKNKREYPEMGKISLKSKIKIDLDLDRQRSFPDIHVNRNLANINKFKIIPSRYPDIKVGNVI